VSEAYKFCPFCEKSNVEQKLIAENGMELPIMHCRDCGEEWENDDTFTARADAWAMKHKRGLAS
jgi:uncharacterized Zn finger protein